MLTDRIYCCLQSGLFCTHYTACPQKTPPSKYDGVVFKILIKHQWNFYNWIQHIFFTLCAKNSWKCTAKNIFYYMFSTTRKNTSFRDNTDYTFRPTVISNEAVWSFISCHKKCSKCPPSTFTHAHRRAGHWVTAALLISWSNLDHSSTSRSTTWSTSRFWKR